LSQTVIDVEWGREMKGIEEEQGIKVRKMQGNSAKEVAGRRGHGLRA
jgi:hypothetical protein